MPHQRVYKQAQTTRQTEIHTQEQNKGKSSEGDDDITSKTCLQAIPLQENRRMKQMPKFISSLVTKPVRQKPPLLRHNTSEELIPLDCMCKPNDSRRFQTFDIPSSRI